MFDKSMKNSRVRYIEYLGMLLKGASTEYS